MKDKSDLKTLEAFSLPTPKGRPKTGNAKTRAQIQSEYRARKASLPNPLGDALLDEVSQLRAQLFNERERFQAWMDAACLKHPDLYDLPY